MKNNKEITKERKRNALHIEVIVRSGAINYDQGSGNQAELKKVQMPNGLTHVSFSAPSYLSSVKSNLEIDNSPIVVQGKDDKGVPQYSFDSSPEEYEEQDLRGYMKTEPKKDDEKGKSLTRSAVVRMSNGISLNPYANNVDLITTLSLAKRIGKNSSLATVEINEDYYSFGFSIDLNRVGIDLNYKMNLSNEEKARRILNFLEGVQFASRDIRGKRENLSPIFIIGGLYNRKTPYFHSRIKANKDVLNVNLLNSVKNSCADTKNNTKVGYLNDMLGNEEEIIDKLNPISIEEFFDNLKREVKEYYEVN